MKLLLISVNVETNSALLFVTLESLKLMPLQELSLACKRLIPFAQGQGDSVVVPV